MMTTSKANNETHGEMNMTRKLQLHIEFLRDMLDTKWADEARKELKEIYADLESKGVVIA